MYAEERQQAIAELVTSRGRLSVTDLATEFDVTTETVRRDLSPLERLGLVRRVHGGAVPTALADHARGRAPRARPGQRRRRRSGSPGPRWRCCPPAGCTVLARRRHHDRAAGRACSPATDRSTVITHAVPIAARLAGAAPHRAAPAARPRPPHHPGGRRARDTVEALAELRADLAFIGTNGISRPARALDPRPRGGRRPSGPWSRRAAGRRARRRHQGRPGAHRPVRRARRGRRAGHRRRHSTTPTGRPFEAPAWRSMPCVAA